MHLAPNLPRRFQFSLRALLVATAVSCLGLGAWHTYSAHFATYVASEMSRVGQPIQLRGRFYLKDGPDSARFEVAAISSNDFTRSTVQGAIRYRAERGRFGLYDFCVPARYAGQDRWTEPGTFYLVVLLNENGRFFVRQIYVKP